MDEKEYSVEDAAKEAGVHQETIRRHIRTGALKAHMGAGKLWREYRIYESDLLAFKERNESEDKGEG
jgi:excisionase family DNA binding protein